MSGLKDRIRSAARRCGFQLCGFARVQRPPHAEFVSQWLAAGNAGTMRYIERGLAKRLDPGLIVPNARTIVTVGYRYSPPPLPPVDWRQELRGRIAAYALGSDYHLTVERKLAELAAGITRICPTAGVRAYVDTGPVLEREWAARGGLGWFGKNTNILHTQEGSWFFLAELLTDLDLEPDPPIADRCGTCTRCLDLCPTQALKPGYGLDARVCISYLTIEHRGPIAVELRSRMGNWVFGCDVCQEVCPWNEKLARHRGVPGARELFPYLPDLLAMTEDDFRRRYGESAIRRAKRDGLLRNVAVALGNTRNPAAVPALTRAVHEDPSPLVRGHAAWALGMIDDATARGALRAARSSELLPEVRAEIIAALEGLAEHPMPPMA